MLNDNTKNIVIVDAYSTGQYYAPEFVKRGFNCIHVQSYINLPDLYARSFNLDNFISNIIFTKKNFTEIIQKIREYKVSLVIAGSEPGVELADRLAQELKLETANSLKLSRSRRDKYEMINSLKQGNLKTTEHIKSDKVEVILAWAESLNQWPVVLKQISSAGGDKVFFCHNSAEIIASFSKIKNTFNALNQKNKEVLAESYLEGEQYLVNVVSMKGVHILSDLWVCEKANKDKPTALLECLKLLPYDHQYAKTLSDYVFNALDALEIKHGPSHNEIVLTKNGPFLLESGARLMGTVQPHLISECIGRSQLDLACEYYATRKIRKEFYVPYKIKKNLFFKFIISKSEGLLKKIKFIDEIKKLRSFSKMNINVKEGSVLKITNDIWTSPGAIVLSHCDETILNSDLDKVRLMENEMFKTTT